MSCKALLSVAALLLCLTGLVSAELPGSEQPTTHTMTIYNGNHVVQRTFVWQNGSWLGGSCHPCDVFCRDCPRSPWHFYGTYSSPRCAEEAACALRAQGIQTSVRHHCA